MYIPQKQDYGKIVVSEIKKTKDAESVQVQLKQYSERTPEENVLGFMMGGHSKFTSQIRKKAVYVSISNKNVGDWKLAEGVDFVKNCDNGRFPNARLQTIETLTPRVYKVNGKVTFQAPKTAGTGGDVLTRDGKAIYQNTTLSLKGEADVLVKHNGTVTPHKEGDKFIYQVDEEEALKAIRAQIKRKNSGFTEADLAIVAGEQEAVPAGDETEIVLPN